ncbi:MAG TPA: VOC family protein [Chitinophagaceae bacterium]|nr:VOC family protein [Chitinophagaceae bacterium]
MKNFLTKVFFVFIALFIYPGSQAQVRGVGAIGITVSEMNRSIKFYSEVLGFRKISDVELFGKQYEQLEGIFGLRVRVARMRLGDEFIELTDYLTSGGRKIPEDTKSNDLVFQHVAIVVSNMERAFEHLRKFHVEYVSTAPQTLPKSIPAAEGIKAFYFHDPDNHNLELIYFPAGKGQSKWHGASMKGNERIFLGIDHTAIGVRNSKESDNFYAGILGLERKGDSWNKGTEQEHLNNVEGASLHITGYRAKEGPGVEFLEYLVPGPGRPYPTDSKANDIWHWQTTLVVDDAEKLYNTFLHLAYKFVSNGLVQLHAKTGDEKKAFVIRDPDGHAILILGAPK